MSTDTDRLGERVASVETGVEQLNERLGALEGRVNTLDERMTARFDRLDTKIEGVETDIGDVEERMDTKVNEAKRDIRRWLVLTVLAISVVVAAFALFV